MLSVSESKEAKEHPCWCCGAKNENKDIFLGHHNDFIHDITLVLCTHCLAELSIEIDRSLVK
jgi:hypothetical protein